jgi:hypothetical protein
MANNIDFTGTFITSSMKPAADEETAALWGQNAADNMGFNHQTGNGLSMISNQHGVDEDPLLNITMSGSNEESDDFVDFEIGAFYNHSQRDLLIKGTFYVLGSAVNNAAAGRSFRWSEKITFAGGEFSGTDFTIVDIAPGLGDEFVGTIYVDGEVLNATVGIHDILLESSGTTNVGGASPNNCIMWSHFLKTSRAYIIPSDLVP